MVHHETSVFEIPKTGTTQLLFLLVLYVFIASSFTYTALKNRTSPGAPDLLVGVGLTPRQYTEWNVSGVRSRYWRFLSAGAAAWSVPYCQYLRPNAQRAMEPRTQQNQKTKTPTPGPGGIYSWWCSASTANGSRSHDCSSYVGLLDLYPALVLYLAGDALRQQPMSSRSHDCSSYVGCGEFRVLQWCHPMPACIGDNRLWHPDDYLTWCPKVDSGPRTSHVFVFK